MHIVPPRRPNATVLPFNRRRSTCRCGASFVPLKPEHRYCRNCWTWGRIGLLIDATRRQFEELRP